MKRFLSILFVGAALLSGNVYGMEKVAIERVKFESHPDIMQRVRDANFIEFVDFEMLQRNVDNLNTIVQSVSDKKLKAEKATTDEIDTLLSWLLVFGGTNHEYETLIADALGSAIKTHGLTNTMQPWEHSLLEKGKDLQGECKKYIDALKEKDTADKDERQKLRANAENRKDQIAGQLFNALKANNTDMLGQILRDELTGDDAPLGGCLDYIDEKVRDRVIRAFALAVDRKEALVLAWHDKFAPCKRAVEQKKEAKELEQIRQRQEERRQQQIEEQRRIGDEQQRENEEVERRQQQRIEDRERLEQERQAEEQRRNVPEEPKVDNPEKQAVDKPDASGPDIAKPVDAPKGIAVLLASITAPKLMVAAVVVGVCYWGYTKYKARKAAQIEEQEKKQEQEDEARKKTHAASQAGKRKVIPRAGKRRG